MGMERITKEMVQKCQIAKIENFSAFFPVIFFSSLFPSNSLSFDQIG